jgi:peptidoglycan/LPS O-acetylase OafA/YrhL
MNKKPSDRNQLIDTTRGLLILLVISFHYLVFWAPPFTPADLYHFDYTYPRFFAIGSFGVHAFFVISGLVIAMTLSSSEGALDFLYRRFARLAPAFAVCCVITFIGLSTWKTEGHIPSFHDFLATLTLHPEKFKAEFIDGAYWSLAVELRFYLWVALFSAMFGRNFWMGIVSFGIAAVIQDLFGLHFTNYYFIGSYVCFFLVGMSFWYFSQDKYSVAGWSSLAVGLLLYCLRMSQMSVEGDYVVAINAMVISFSILLFLSINFGLGDSWKLGPLPYLGRLSYTLYLLHQEIGVLIIGHIKQNTTAPDFLAVGIALLSSLALSVLVYHTVEKPGQAFLRGLRIGGRPTLSPDYPLIKPS